MSFLLWFPLRGNRMDLFWNFWVYISKKKNIYGWFLFFYKFVITFFFFFRYKFTRDSLYSVRWNFKFDETGMSNRNFWKYRGIYEGAYVYNKSCRRFLSFTPFHLPLVVDRFWSQLSINRLNVSRKKIRIILLDLFHWRWSIRFEDKFILIETLALAYSCIL